MLLLASLSAEPGSVLDAALGVDMLMVACLALGLVAVVSIGGVLKTRREARAAARIARTRADGFQDLMRTMRMAETIAGIGIWYYDPATGTQNWSDGLKRLFGIETDEPFVEGDAETLLCANNIDLTGSVADYDSAIEPFTLQFDLHGFDGNPRTISVHACNLRDSQGAVQRVVAVVRDISEQVARERALESSRDEAVNEAKRALVLADVDPLTGLVNRRRALHELDHMVMSARQTQMPMVVVMFDIDHLKRVNAAHGQSHGDKVLKQVARIARETAREVDVIGRVGGEEFIWIIPGASAGMARVMSERLRQAIAKGSAIDGRPPVTISIGFTTVQVDDTGLSMFARADAALFEAKNSGRNRVRVTA